MLENKSVIETRVLRLHRGQSIEHGILCSVTVGMNVDPVTSIPPRPHCQCHIFGSSIPDTLQERVEIIRFA